MKKRLRLHTTLDTRLGHDLPQILQSVGSRRDTLNWLCAGAAAATGLVACGGGDGGASNSGSTTSSTSTSGCSVIPSETAGPYPGDGSNSSGGTIANVLIQSGVVRSDIRSSFGGSTTTAPGVGLTVTLKLVNTNASCANLAGNAIYLWHCDRDGNYSMYSSGVTSENYLRGVQVTDANGEVTFTTIFPGCYSGRWPHLHFEVYSSLTAATSTPASDQVKTSQLALPSAACNAVYATTGYSASVSNFAAASLASDNVFGNDSGVLQLANLSGSPSAGYSANLQVGIAA
ncbi:MAG: intradiol ring-cleavage dioxygenase [Betaproteobacteria bacterium]|nr:intradiol ring-cleavage dioxygenase [Betaproteobacteria bacterium]